MRIRPRVRPPEEVLRGEAVQGDGKQFVDALEGVEEEIGAIHLPILRHGGPARDPSVVRGANG